MNHSSEQAIKRQVQTYVRVFIALAMLTVLTVGVSYLKLPVVLAVTVALFIAFVKGSLVAAFFMHLASEKKLIFSILILAAVFFLFLLLTPFMHSN